MSVHSKGEVGGRVRAGAVCSKEASLPSMRDGGFKTLKESRQPWKIGQSTHIVRKT